MFNLSQLRLEQVNLYAKRHQQQGYPILEDISFEVKAGDRVAIVGSIASGKTSLLRLLNRLSEPSSGKIYLENQEYSQIPVLKLRSQITLVPQEPKLLGMTVREALTYPLVLRGVPKQVIQQRLTESLDQLHIDSDLLGRTEVQLSLGQRQIVALARALMIQPQILLLDEPTSALDAGRATHLLTVLTDLSLKPTTIFMVNHQLNLAQTFCTRLLHLQQGRLIQNSTSADVDFLKLHDLLIQAEVQAEQEWT
ncbi:MAG: ATP-binding cassette domain-containing protein [Nostocaceae cyanobacterium]|nr:ATP-binding cassette domain-containing protein [Nostocaceae cyanobacterium]